MAITTQSGLITYTGYRYRTGMWAFVLHRLSGFVLALYLIVHVWVVRTVANGPEGFNSVMKLLDNPINKFLEIGLYAVVLFHSLNGIRILIVDTGKGSTIHKKLFWILMAVGIVFFILGAIPMLPHF